MIIGVKICEAKNTVKKYENLGHVYIRSEIIDNEYIKLIFSDPIVPEENNIIDIQFHEGDYVENNEGKIGYISSICYCDECKKRGFFEPTITYSDGTTDYISNYSVKTVSSDYKQIGIQKFSTKDILRNRISALEKENKELTEKINHLINRNQELLSLYCVCDMERNGTKQ